MRTLVIRAGAGELRIPAVLVRRGLEVDRIEIEPVFSVVAVGFEATAADSLRTLRATGVCAGWGMRQRVARQAMDCEPLPW
jgi:hypothetical protein